jgi:hypothetical protein
MELGGYSDDELVDLLEAIAREQDQRNALDPVPWGWVRWDRVEHRQATGPYNDGPAYPNGTLSQLVPRPGYRQDPAAYEHTRTWRPEDGDDKFYDRRVAPTA